MYADGWGAFNDSFDAAACSSYGGTPCEGGGDLSSVVTFDIDGVDDCGFVSINGSFPDDAGATWSGWGAHTDNGMQQTVAPGSYEFQVLCVDTSIPNWWDNIGGASTVLTAPLGSECDFNPADEWNNYGFTVDGSGDAVTVSYCAGSCDADCPAADPCADVTCADGQSCEDGLCVDDPEPDTGVVFSGAFGGTGVDGNTYTNPTGSEGWAGFANEDTDLYPFSFSDGGEITFTGATAGTDADVYFRFEYNPYPDTEPSFNTAAVTVSGTDEASYSVEIPAQGANTFSSFLLYVTTLDAPVTLTNVAVTGDSGGGDDGGGGDLSSEVTFDLDGVDDCGFLSVTGTWDGWSGWGAHTDSGMAADIPAGDHEFIILCVNTEGEWWNDIWGSSTVYNAPIDGSCWNGNSEYPNYVLNVDGSGDAVTVSYCAGSCEETCSDDECTMGDVNGDGDVNVLDIIQIVGYVISGTADFDLACADSNGDGVVNILDIVALVSDILGGRVDILDATTGKLIRDYGALMLKANGYIGGVQMTLKHGADFTIELTDNALVADSRTVGNETKLVIVVPGSEELFTFTGDFEIVDMIVANSSERVNVTAPTAFSLSEAYPNPFNPTTSMTLAVPVAGNVSVQVYNIMGQVVATLASGHMDASTYTLTWDASNVSSGMYFIKAEAAGSVTTQKLVLMK